MVFFRSRSRSALLALALTAPLVFALAVAPGSAAPGPAAGVAQSGSPAPASAAPGTASPPPASPTAASDPLLRRLIAEASAIATYHARISADIAFHSFPYIATHLDGDVYFKRPDRQAVVFETVPVLAGSIKKFYPNVPSPARWAQIYTISSLGDSAGATTYRLIPKRHGRVEHLDVRVDDTKATIGTYTWTYEDGGDITFDQTFVAVDGHAVVATQTGRVELPAYKADVRSTISNYKLNVPVADTVFAEPA